MYVTGTIYGSFVMTSHIAWYEFRILCLWKVCCLVCVRMLYSQKVHCLVWFLPDMISGPFVISKYILESMTLYLFLHLGKLLEMWILGQDVNSFWFCKSNNWSIDAAQCKSFKQILSVCGMWNCEMQITHQSESRRVGRPWTCMNLSNLQKTKYI